MIGHPLLVVAQRYIHEDIAEGGFEADNQRFRVFAGLVALLSSEKERGMYAEMKALVVERRDGVTHDLVRKFEDGFLDQRVRLGQFGTGVVAGDLDCRLRFEVEYDPALYATRQRYHARHTLAAIGILFHGKVRHLGGAL